MKRRNFVRNLVAAAPVPALLGAQTATTTTAPPAQPSASPAAALPRPLSRQPLNVTPLKVTAADLAAQGERRFFSAEQFATLRQLGAVMMPPIKSNPGATEAGAAEFLDFLIGVSPVERQDLYRQGLDALDRVAKDKNGKPFAELTVAEAGAVMKPLMTVRLWHEDMPADPLQHFMAQAHDDVRAATMNSREYVTAMEKTHRFTGRARTSGMYWAPIDPVIEA